MIHRFAVDKMLGRLATWLRLIGQDATWGSHLSGATLVRQARAERRTILTRDRQLARPQRHAGVPLLLIQSNDFRAQLLQVIRTFALDPYAYAFTRCIRCNVPVMPLGKEAVADRVPAYVLATHTEFARCPRCGRIYWPATHHDHVVQELRALLGPATPAA